MDNVKRARAWKTAWRQGIAPQLEMCCLLALRRGLIESDPALIRGATTRPPRMATTEDEPIVGGCPIAYAIWRGWKLTTVVTVSDQFRKVIESADMDLEQLGLSHATFTLWWDYSLPDAWMELLAEVEASIQAKTGSAHRRAALEVRP